ncbi:Dor1-domain-containing protein [Salix suchowensis]|nr:Dor1-domain-containing protein [Salix suchowensis]
MVQATRANKEYALTHLDQPARSPPVLLSSIIAEVDQSITQMLVSLLATLHEPHRKLPALFKAVNFLRRMNVFGGATNSTSPTTPIPSPVATKVTGKGTDLTPGHTHHGASTDETIQAEQQLALAFLSGRETCLVASLDGCGRNIQGGIYELQATPGEGRRQLEERELEDIARYLKKYIDTWREAAYDILCLYLPRPPCLRFLLNSPIVRPPLGGRPRFPWTSRRHNGEIRVAVVRRDIQAAGNVWAQELLKSYEPEEIDDGKTDTTMSRSKSSGNKSGVRVNRVPSKWLISPSLVASPPRPLPSGTSNPAHIPPPLLASYPPLAVFTNALLTTLNGLRLLAPLHVKDALIRVMDEEMVNGGQVLLRFAEAVGADKNWRKERST